MPSCSSSLKGVSKTLSHATQMTLEGSWRKAALAAAAAAATAVAATAAGFGTPWGPPERPVNDYNEQQPLERQGHWRT